MTNETLMSALAVLLATGPALTVIDAQDTRRTASIRWELTSQFDDAAGVYLTNPVLISACGGALAVLDLGTPHVIHFSMDLKPLSKFGRAGAGPGELRSPSDLACDSQGTAWLPDGANGRVLRVSAMGTYDGMVRIDRELQRLATAPDGQRFWISTSDPSQLVVAFSRTGEVAARAFAPADLQPIDMLRREPWLVTTPDGAVIVAFRWSSRLLRIEADGTPGFSVDGPEKVDFPLTRSYSVGGGGRNTMVRIAPGSTEAALQLFRDEDVINVRFKGAGPDKGKIVDRFNAKTGAYIESIRLPVVPVAVAFENQTAYLLVADPVPAIQVYRMHRSR